MAKRDKQVIDTRNWSLVARMRLGLFLLFLPVLMLGAIYYLHMEHSQQSELQQRQLATNQQLRHVLIEPYLHELERQFTQIYERVKGDDFSGPVLLNQSHYLRQWALYKGIITDLSYAYVGTAQGKMLIYPELTLAAGYDPRDRPWYRLASEHVGEMVWTEPYQGYGDSTRLMISLAKALTDKHGKVQAVVAIDIVLAPFSAQLNQRADQGYQMIVSQSGKVLAHPDVAQLLKPMAHPEWLAHFTEDEGIFLDKATRHFVAYGKLPERNWWLIQVQPAASLQAVVTSVSLNVLSVVVLACVLYLLLALAWARYFRRMQNEISLMIRASRLQPNEIPRGGMRELRHVYAELAEVGKDYHEVRQQANMDKLTGLYNRRFFDEHLNLLLLEQQPFCLAMIDLDDFKQINDTYGHQTGDVVLKRVAKLGRQLLGERGWLCRYGGEELMALMVEPDIHSCQALLEQFRIGVTALDWREPGLRLTFSAGLVASGDYPDAKSLLGSVDAEVYRAKRDGKDRIYLGAIQRQPDLPALLEASE